MTTIINGEPVVERRTTIERTSDSSSGWAVAVVILIAVIVVGGILWMRSHKAVPATTTGGANINVTIPTGGSQSPAGDTSGGATY